MGTQRSGANARPEKNVVNIQSRVLGKARTSTECFQDTTPGQRAPPGERAYLLKGSTGPLSHDLLLMFQPEIRPYDQKLSLPEAEDFDNKSIFKHFGVGRTEVVWCTTQTSRRFKMQIAQ